MSKGKKSKKIINKIGYVICTLFLIVLGLFIGLLIYMDVIPPKYFYPVVGVSVFIAILNAVILYMPRVKSKLKIIFIVLAILLSVLFGFVAQKLFITNDFLEKITNTKYETEDYYVIVLNDKNYKKLSDLDNLKTGIYKNSAKTYKEARKELLGKIKTTNVDYEDVSILADDLLNERVNAMFISSVYKNTLDEEKATFKESTKVLYTISIKTKAEDISKAVKVTEQPFNIFVSGIDTTGKISNVSRSDVNMIVSVNPNTNKILLTSIPRDYYVQLHGTTGLKDKLTHAGIYGVNKSITTLEDLFKTDINYYVRVNFTTLTKLVDNIGGIDVYSDASFYCYTDPGVYVRKGNNHFNGRQALAFSRERYAYQEGDRHRVKNQQDVFTAIFKKISSSQTLISKYDSILGTLDQSFQTNMSQRDIKKLVKRQLDKMPSWTIENQSVNGTDSSAETYSYAGQKLYVMIPDMKTVETASARIDAFLKEK